MNMVTVEPRPRKPLGCLIRPTHGVTVARRLTRVPDQADQTAGWACTRRASSASPKVRAPTRPLAWRHWQPRPPAKPSRLIVRAGLVSAAYKSRSSHVAASASCASAASSSLARQRARRTSSASTPCGTCCRLTVSLEGANKIHQHKVHQQDP